MNTTIMLKDILFPSCGSALSLVVSYDNESASFGKIEVALSTRYRVDMITDSYWY